MSDTQRNRAVKLDHRRTVVLLALAAGKSRVSAAAKASITDRTLRRWVESEPDFADAVDIALNAGRAMYEELIADAAKSDWRAAAWMLEVLHYGRAKSGPLEEPIPTSPVAGVARTPEEVEERRQKVLLLLVRAVGQEQAERVLARRAEEIAGGGL
jgi:hypothetical protein